MAALVLPALGCGGGGAPVGPPASGGASGETPSATDAAGAGAAGGAGGVGASGIAGGAAGFSPPAISAAGTTGSAGARARPGLSFVLPSSLAVSATAVAAADFDLDGRPDLAVAISDGTIGILRNLGKRAFAAPDVYAAGSAGTSVILTHDLNADGRTDLAILDKAGVGVLLNKGDGSFTIAGHFGGSGLNAFALGDVNGDGLADMVATHPGTEDVDGGDDVLGDAVLFLNMGAGHFAPPAVLTSAYPRVVALGDVDDDGRLDLLIGELGYGNSMVDAFKGDGHGHFARLASSQTSVSAFTSFALADIDGDGRKDLAFSSEFDVGFMPSLGGGKFGTPIEQRVGRSVTVAAADLDGDSRPELVAAARFDVSVIHNDGRGALGLPVAYAPALRSATAGGVVPSVAVADFDGDGHRDVAAAGGVVTLLFGNGDGTFAAPRDYADAWGGGIIAAVGDVDGDGRADLFGGWGARLSFGRGLFAAPILGSGSEGAGTLAALGDLDGDGKNEFIMSTSAGVLIQHNEGQGKFAGAAGFVIGDKPSAILVADLDHDGRLDLCGSGNEQVYVLHNDGGGAFTPTLVSAPGVVGTAAVGDLDGDGFADVVAISQAAALDAGATPVRDGVSVLLNKHDGTFAAPTRVVFGAGRLDTIALADLDGDGRLDVVFAGQEEGVARNLGHQTFDTPVIYDDVSTRMLALGDLDGDGASEIVYTDGTSARVLLNDGAGHFTPSLLPLAAGALPWSVAVGDLDGDGRNDVAVGTDIGDGYVRVFSNSSGP